MLFQWQRSTISLKRLFREHNHQVDHLANLGAEGQKNTRWKRETIQKTGRQIEGFGIGNTKTDGRSGCGVVVKCVDQDKWITISKLVVPLKTCAAVAAEVAGASVLIGILDLVLGEEAGERGEISVENKPVH